MSDTTKTRQQRRKETAGWLLEASIATLIEVGYTRPLAAVITKRVGVSVRALFCHFETMRYCRADMTTEVLRRQLD